MQPVSQIQDIFYDPQLFYSPTLSELLDRHPLTVAPDTPVVEVLAMMSQAWSSLSPVNNESLSLEPEYNSQSRSSCVLVTVKSELVGVFTERDVVRLTASGSNLAGVVIAAVMSQPVHVLKVNEFRDIFTVLSLLKQHQIRHLPAIDEGGKLVGLIAPYTLRSVLTPANLLKLRTVSEVMNPEVIYAFREDSALSLAQLMAKRNVSCVVVVEEISCQDLPEEFVEKEDETRRLKPVGIVTERDIVQFQVLELNLSTLQAGEVMSQPLFNLCETDNLWVAHQEMQRRMVRRLIVTNQVDELVGIVTQTSLLQIFDPMEMYNVIHHLQRTVGQLKAEKLELLESRNAELESLVQSRTAELEQQAQRERLLSAIALRVRQSLNLQEIFDATVNEVRQLLQCDRVLVYQFESDWNGTIVAESVGNYTSVVQTKIRDTYFQETEGKDYLQGRRQVTANIYQEGLDACHLELLESLQVKAILTVPVIISEQLWGLLVAHQCSDQREWHQEELDLLEKLSVQIAIAIQQAKAFQQVQTELLERQKAQEQAQASQQLLDLFYDSVPIGLCILDEQGHFVRVNPAFCQLFGYQAEDLLEKPFTDLLPYDSEGEWQVRRLDGKLLDINLTSGKIINLGSRSLQFAIIIDISDRKKYERELQEIAQRLSIVIETVGEGITLSDEQGKFSIFNSQMQEMTGYSLEEVNRCENFLGLLYPQAESYQEVMQRLYTLNQKRIIRNVETKIKSKSGVNRTLLVSSSIIKTNDRDLFLSAYRDISARKQAEEALIESQKQYQSVVNNVKEVIFQTDIYGVWNFLNPAWTEITGFSVTESLGTEILDYIHSDDCDLMLRQIQRLIDNQKEYFCQEVRYLTKNADCRWIEHSARLTRAADGSIAGMTGTLNDITDRKQAEEALQRLNEQLEIRVAERTIELANAVELLHREINERKKTEAKLLEVTQLQQAILDGANYTIISTGPSGIIQTFNRAAQHLLGYTLEEVVGKVMITAFHDPEETEQRREPLAIELSQTIASGLEVLVTKPRLGLADEREWTYIRKDGSRFPVLLSVTALRDAEGEITGFLGIGSDITKRQEAEKALQESQRLIQRIADSTPNILYIYDLIEARNVYTNKEIGRILGYQPEDIKQPGFVLNLIHPEDRPRIELHQQRFNTAKEGDILELEYRARDAKGQWRWFYSWETLFNRTVDGRAQQILGTASDITARKQVEEALRKQVERERLIGAISQRIRQSLNLETILKTTVEEVQQLLAADRVLVYQVFSDGTGSAIAEAVASEWPKVLNLIFPPETFPEDCYRAYVSGRVYVLADRDQDRVLPCMVDFMQQFSVRAKLVVPIVQQDLLWGLLIAHQCSEPREWQPWEIELLQQLATQLAIAIQQSGLYKQLESELSDRKRAEEQLSQTNERLAITNAELARATRLKDEFLANMSHELRTPLNAILGMSEGLLEQITGPLNERQCRAIATIEKSGKHLLELINDILDLAKIESGKLELLIAPTSIYRLCESSLTFVKQQATQKQISLLVSIPEGLGEIALDERRMRQVLINLLSNSVKFTPNGGRITVEVEIESYETWEAGSRTETLEKLTAPQEGETFVSQTANFRAKGDILNISVIDTGIGIAPENMNKLFQSFVQIDSSLTRQYAGTGLGLALVRRIIELHGGGIAVESKVGQGSRFTVKLPWQTGKIEATPPSLPETSEQQFWPQSTVTPETSSVAEPTLKSNQSASSPVILLAEDNEANIETLLDYLMNQGYRIILAKNGWEAVKMTKEQKPNLILMDIQMPGMDGLAATKQIKMDREISEIPIIALTALAMPGDEEKCLKAGASEYMKKPVSLKQLVKNIQRLLSS
ncbi:MAG: PAS domain S-box protein [Actinomycetota bacterium]